MNKSFIKLLSVCFFCMMFFASCERFPVSSLLGLPDPVGSWPDTWYLYDDELNTKGSMEPYVFNYNPDGSPNPYCDTWEHVGLSFKCIDYPKKGTKCIKLTWVGNNLATPTNPRKTFFSFGIQAREDLGGKIDLTNSGYTNLRFWVRGTLHKDCSFEIGIPGTSTTVTINDRQISSQWEEYILPVEGVGEIEYDLYMAIKTNGVTNGGTVYIDDIRLTKELL